jgi:hypothetical protein
MAWPLHSLYVNSRHIFIVVFFILPFLVIPQVWKWGYAHPGYGLSRTLTYDRFGNIYYSGSFNEAFIGKLNGNGIPVWFKQTSGAGSLDIAVGKDTNIYIVGNGYAASSSFIKHFNHNGTNSWNYWNGGQA